MNYEDFAAYWNANEAGLRRYAAGLGQREDIVDEVLAAAHAELESNLDAIEPEPYCFYGAVYRAVSPFIPPMNYETYALIRALKATGNDKFDGRPEVVRNFLVEWHLEELEVYHPVLRHIDLTAVDWWEVTLAVLA